jgi:uncharacterized membrane protein YqaE (UPF0057 family)
MYLSGSNPVLSTIPFFHLILFFMKNNHLLRLLLVVLASQAIFSCQSTRNFQSASVKAAYNSPQQQEVLAQRDAIGQQSATPSQQVTEADAALQADASGDEAYAKEAAKPVSANEKMLTRQLQSHTISPNMKAALQKAKTAVETNQADRAAGKKVTKEAKKMEKAAMRSVLKEAKANADDQKVLEIILAILIPPLGVYLHEDEINSKFWIALVLTLLFFIPGVIYALLVVTDSI